MMSSTPEQWVAPRTRPGVGPTTRKAKATMRAETRPFLLPEGFIQHHHDRSPPDAVKAAFEDVFGDRKNIRLYFHPILLRWMLIQPKILQEGTGRVLAWESVTVFSENQNLAEDYIPSDWVPGTPQYELLAQNAGLIGEYREPTKADFELVMEWASTRYNDKLWEKIEAKEQELERHAESDMEAMEHDVATYYARLFMEEETGMRMTVNMTDTGAHSAWQAIRDHVTWRYEYRTSANGERYAIRHRRPIEERDAIAEKVAGMMKAAGDHATRHLMTMMKEASKRAEEKRAFDLEEEIEKIRQETLARMVDNVDEYELNQKKRAAQVTKAQRVL